MIKEGKNPSCEVGFFTSLGFLLGAVFTTFVVLLYLSPRAEIYFFPPGPNSDLRQRTQGLLAVNVDKGSRAASKRSMPRTTGGELSQVHSTSVEGASYSPASGGGGASGEEISLGAKPGSSEAKQLLKEAMSFVDKGEPYKAMTLLEKILADDPKNEQALIELGMIHLIDLQDTQAALPLMERAFQVNSDNKVVLSELMGIYDETGQSEAGLAYLQGLYDEKPENATVAMGIGQMLKEQNRPHEAIPFWEKVAENPQGDQGDIAHSELGELYQKTGQLDKSLSSFQQAASSLQQKYDNGFFAHDDEMGREELVNAQLNVVKVLISQGRQREAQEIIDDKLKNLFHGNLADMTKQIEKSTMFFGYKQ